MCSGRVHLRPHPLRRRLAVLLLIRIRSRGGTAAVADAGHGKVLRDAGRGAGGVGRVAHVDVEGVTVGGGDGLLGHFDVVEELAGRRRGCSVGRMDGDGVWEGGG